MFQYLDVRNLDDELDIRIHRMAFVTLPKQLCTGKGNDTLVRPILWWINLMFRVDQGREVDLHPIILGWSASGNRRQVRLGQD